MDPSAPPSPEVIAAAIPAIKKLVANVLIGFSISTVVFGVSVLQAYRYYRNYPDDKAIIKWTVAILCLLDTMSTALVAHSLYIFLVINLGNPVADFEIPISFAIENGVVTCVVVIAQLFYAQQIWTLGKSKIVRISRLVAAFTSFGIGLDITDYVAKTQNVFSLLVPTFKVKATLVQGFAAFADIAIAAAMCWYLHGQHSVFKRTQELVNTLMIYAISRGVLTAVCQILFLALFAAIPLEFTWLVFHQLLGKLYINSVFMTLNIRKGLKETHRVTTTTLHLTNLGGTTDSTAGDSLPQRASDKSKDKVIVNKEEFTA